MSSILSEFDMEKYEKVIRQDGYIEGFEFGFEIGKESVREEVISKLLIALRKIGVPKEGAKIEIEKSYNLSEEQVNMYIEKYWK